MKTALDVPDWAIAARMARAALAWIGEIKEELAAAQSRAEKAGLQEKLEGLENLLMELWPHEGRRPTMEDLAGYKWDGKHTIQ